MYLEYIKISEFIGSVLIFALYDIFLVKFIKELIGNYNNSRLVLICGIVLDVLTVFLRAYGTITIEEYYIIKISIYIVMIKIIFDVKVLSAVYISATTEFYLLGFSELIISILAIVKDESCLSIVNDSKLVIGILIISRVINIICFKIILKKSKQLYKKVRNVIKNKEIIQITISQFVLSLLLILFEIGYVLELSQVIYFYVFVIIILINAMYNITFLDNIVIKSSVFLLKDEKNILQSQLVKQKQHYKELENDISEVKKLNHDYNGIVKTINKVIANSDESHTKTILEEFKNKIVTLTSDKKTYSNNMILNIILNDVEKECKENNIEFSGNILFPESNKIQDIDLIRLFNNIFSNAIEANKKVNDINNRYIKVQSKISKGWIILTITNSFEGDLVYKNGMLQSVKSDKVNHGNGFKIIEEITSDNHILLSHKINKKNKEFEIRLVISDKSEINKNN